MSAKRGVEVIPGPLNTEGIQEMGMLKSDRNTGSAFKLKEGEEASKPKASGAKRGSGKVSERIEEEKNLPLSYVYGAISGLFIGFSLCFSADLGQRLDGFQGPASFWPGCLLTWICFHFKEWIWWKTGKKEDEAPGEPWLCSPKRSMYYELFFDDDGQDQIDADDEQKEGGSKDNKVHDSSEVILMRQRDIQEGGDAEAAAEAVIGEFKDAKTHLGFSWSRFSGSLSRGTVELFINVALIYSFMFAEKSGINPGIISSIFSSTCVFTIILFYFLYGQKLSVFDFIGIFFIIGSVVFISMGGGESSDEESTRRLLAGAGPRDPNAPKLSKEEANMFLYFGIIAALLAGFVLSVNSVSLLYCGHVGCRIDQANFDGNFIMFCIFFPMYLIIEYNNPGTYTARDLFSGSMDIITITIGVIAQGKGLAIGNGGPIQALENQKVVVVTVVTAIVYQNMPTVLQICGLVSGIVGVMFIVFQKQKGSDEEGGKKAPELVH